MYFTCTLLLPTDSSWTCSAVAKAMVATFAWNLEGSAEIHTPVAQAFGSEYPESMASNFANFIRSFGIKTDLASEYQDVNVENLVNRMAAPENQAMRKANVRPMLDDDLPTLAEMMLSFK